MGADISFVVEHRDGSDRAWRIARRPGSSSLDWYDDQAYECFSLLTGLDFSARKLRPLLPIAPLRGWPEDLSAEARARLTSWSDDTAFGKSWLNTSDFDAYDWDAPMTWTFMASPPAGLAVSEAVKAEVRAHIDHHRWLPAGWRPAGWSRDGFDVAVPTTPRDRAGRFLDVIQDMAALGNGDPTSVRCVFEFTR